MMKIIRDAKRGGGRKSGRGNQNSEGYNNKMPHPILAGRNVGIWTQKGGKCEKSGIFL